MCDKKQQTRGLRKHKANFPSSAFLFACEFVLLLLCKHGGRLIEFFYQILIKPHRGRLLLLSLHHHRRRFQFRPMCVTIKALV